MTHHKYKLERREFLYDPYMGIPIITHDMIALKAYFLWKNAGKPDGNDWLFWFEAEKEIKRDLGA